MTTSQRKKASKALTSRGLTRAFSDDDRAVLETAHEHLEDPSLAAKLTGVVGTPIEIALKLLPKAWYTRLHAVVHASIEKALDAAISSMRIGSPPVAHEHFYKALGMFSGAAGGFFGLPALLVELPVSTTIMLRSIADIARSEGENLEFLDARMACMEVFALGGRTEEDDAADTGYYGIRAALGLSVWRASSHITDKGLAVEGGPALAELISLITGRFGIAVTDRAASQIVPVIGAGGAALVNLIFLNHFQDMARSHFGIRRLERKYGADPVKTEYERLT